MTEIVLTRVLETLLFLPGITILLIGAAIILWRHRSIARVLVIAALAILYVGSAPLFADFLLGSLEEDGALHTSELQQRQAQAIVVLGAGRYKDAPEYGGETISRITLQRVRYGAWLARRTDLPVLVSGGSPGGGSQTPEAELMREILVNELHIREVWTENDSRTTYENARFCAEILKNKGIHRIYLVTNAWHMPRAVYSFRNMGVEVIAAPTGFADIDYRDEGFMAWLPSYRALQRTDLALHEYAGLFWYRLRY
jgi:uncharacterized SAM-binding protein YcdF (DUF218 family)